MAQIFSTTEATDLLTGLRLARAAIGRGELIVIPTDTVYGVAADAFSPAAVQRLLDAKGRGRQSPPPVLAASTAAITALASSVPPAVSELAEAFWPGALTIILPAQESLAWDLGDTNGSVALRIPNNPITLELLAETGPLAVSSANLTGEPVARTAAEAKAALGDRVAVYLDSGTLGSAASTILDATAHAATGAPIRIVRAGAIGLDALRAVLGERLADS